MSDIEWTDVVWNPVSGCTRASRGCDNCYAVNMTRRLGAQGHPKYVGLVNAGKGHFNGTVRTHEDELEKPLGWRKPRHVFVNSMSDLFHRDVPFEFIDRVYDVMCRTPQHTYQILTKRPERMAEFFSATEPGGALIRPPLPNVWLGTSVEDQAAADERIPHLLRVPAAVRFLSCEPLLGPVDLRLMAPTFGERHRAYDLHWVIVGGESGAGARACDVGWIRSVVQQCQAAGVRVFTKQLGRHVITRNDDGFFADGCDGGWPGHPETDDVPGYQGWQGDPVRVRLRDAKGGDMAEWPEDLRVREMPV